MKIIHLIIILFFSTGCTIYGEGIPPDEPIQRYKELDTCYSEGKIKNCYYCILDTKLGKYLSCIKEIKKND